MQRIARRYRSLPPRSAYDSGGTPSGVQGAEPLVGEAIYSNSLISFYNPYLRAYWAEPWPSELRQLRIIEHRMAHPVQRCLQCASQVTLFRLAQHTRHFLAAAVAGQE